MADTAAANPSDLLTSEEVLDRLLADVRLQRVALTCVLPAIRSSGRWRFRQTDLEEWIERQRQSFERVTS